MFNDAIFMYDKAIIIYSNNGLGFSNKCYFF